LLERRLSDKSLLTIARLHMIWDKSCSQHLL
jgi:hypothetical protein